MSLSKNPKLKSKIHTPLTKSKAKRLVASIRASAKPSTALQRKAPAKSLIKGYNKHSDERGAYHQSKTLDDVCWVIEDILQRMVSIAITLGTHKQAIDLLTKRIKALETPKQSQVKNMDKKMAKVTEKMKTAEKEVKGGKKEQAFKTLHKAEKDNKKLTKIDKEVRDPLIEKCKKNSRKHK